MVKKNCVGEKRWVFFIFFCDMNRLRHYVTYGNTRDFRPEDEEKPSDEVTIVQPAWSDAEIGKHRFRRHQYFNKKNHLQLRDGSAGPVSVPRLDLDHVAYRKWLLAQRLDTR